MTVDQPRVVMNAWPPSDLVTVDPDLVTVDQPDLVTVDQVFYCASKLRVELRMRKQRAGAGGVWSAVDATRRGYWRRTWLGSGPDLGVDPGNRPLMVRTLHRWHCHWSPNHRHQGDHQS